MTDKAPGSNDVLLSINPENAIASKPSSGNKAPLEEDKTAKTAIIEAESKDKSTTKRKLKRFQTKELNGVGIEKEFNLDKIGLIKYAKQHKSAKKKRYYLISTKNMA